ncbi:MAG: cyclophilin-like fold protein [Brevinema sp.]
MKYLIPLLLLALTPLHTQENSSLYTGGGFNYIYLHRPYAVRMDTENRMIITANNSSFEVVLENNASTQALKSLLPLNVVMKDLHQNEKYYYLSSTLPTNPQAVKSISAGDVMLYGNNCIVIFYENFSTSYQYTKLGKIRVVSGLKKALGSGDVTVNISIK